MGLLDDARTASAILVRTPCRVWSTKENLSKQDAKELDEALADPSVTGKAIADVLKARGHNINQGSVTRHRRGDCACGDS